MGKSVGLDIHARGVRAVEVTRRGKGFRVNRYVERSLTPRGGAPDPEELREALLEIFRTGKFSKNNVLTAVEAHDTVVREIPVPFKADDQIRKVVKYEAEHHLHDCDAEDVIVQYTRVGESVDGTNLLVFAARKTAIGRRIEHTRSAGVEPLAMDLDALAAYNAISAAGLLEETPCCVLLEIGHRSTGMVFVVEGEVRALRSVRMGIDSIAHGLARDMEIDFLEADHKLVALSADEDGGDLLLPVEDLSERKETSKSHAELERDLFHQKRDEFVARLRREFVRSSAALRGAGKPERIIATGQGLHVPGLLDLLGRRLGISVDVFRPSRHFTCKLDDTPPDDFDAAAAVALGLALKGIGHDPLGIDFRQEELQVANKFELLKNSLAVTVTLAIFGLLVFTSYCVVKKSQLQKQRFEPMLTQVYQSFAEVATDYNALGDKLPRRDQVDPNHIEGSGERPLAVKRFINELRRMKGVLRRVVGDDKGLPEIHSALNTWNQIFGVVTKHHEKIDYIDFETISIEQDQVRLNVVLPSIAEAETLGEPLKSLEALAGMRLEGLQAEPIKDTDKQRVPFYFKRKRTRR
ncbi:MAG: pilus assembly protein PilM [Planctomycetota bacterium]|jgi:type IV pilus assembly protein PilM